jgi:hypothetical protein
MKIMRWLVAAIGLVWAVLPAAGQDVPTATYFGWDGPPGASGGTYIANVYGDAIEIVPRADRCGRPFYIQGVMSIRPNLNTGTIGGTMYRCTTTELVTNCGHPANYEISFQGSVRRDESHRRLFLDLNYTMEIWNKDTCMKERDEQRTESILLLYQPPTPPPPTTTQTIDDAFDDFKQKVFDWFWTLDGRSPR